ncbi:MAG TPA: ROK family protein [Symbiobacteriaceae bacterium]|jgi:glucokinase
MSGAQRPALGIDLGGTAIKAGVVTHDGRIIGRGERATEVEKGVGGVVANLALAARDAMANAGIASSEIAGAGIGAPGICNPRDGVVVNAVNLFWHEVPVASLLKAELGLRVLLDNDANCAALGEQWCGAAKGSDHAFMVTLGTGVGGGLILNGKIYGGFSGWAGEFGHIPAVENGPHCNCGQHGCLETVASATAIAAAARTAIDSGWSPALARMATAQEGRVDARLVITAARAGDEPAREILAEAGRHLGRVLAGLVTALNPELIVVGGGASHAGDFLLEPCRQVVREKTMPGPGGVVRIVRAALGNDGGLIGAASLAWR